MHKCDCDEQLTQYKLVDESDIPPQELEEETIIQQMLQKMLEQDEKNYKIEIERHLGVEEIKEQEIQRRQKSSLFTKVEQIDEPDDE